MPRDKCNGWGTNSRINKAGMLFLTVLCSTRIPCVINRPLLAVQKWKVFLEYFLLALCNSKIWINTRNIAISYFILFCKDKFVEKPSSSQAKMTNVKNNKSKLGTLSKRKNDIIWEIFPTWGGVFPNPKTFVNLPSIFLYAKFILRC